MHSQILLKMFQTIIFCNVANTYTHCVLISNELMFKQYFLTRLLIISLKWFGVFKMGNNFYI